MGNYDFGLDLHEAKIVEAEAAQQLKKYFNDVKDIKHYDGKEFDIECLVGAELTRFEVKNELMVSTTGNVAVEFSSRGHDSGITTTTANYWITMIRGNFFIIEVDRLRSLIKSDNTLRQVTGGDPGSNTKMHLVPESKFKSWCQAM